MDLGVFSLHLLTATAFSFVLTSMLNIPQWKPALTRVAIRVNEYRNRQ